MIIIETKLEGQFARPHDHPITCANPAPWKIIEIKLECNPLKVWIRGEGSIWFRADHCWLGEKDELEEIHPDVIATPADAIFEKLAQADSLSEEKPLHSCVCLLGAALALWRLYPTARFSQQAKDMLNKARQLSEVLNK